MTRKEAQAIMEALAEAMIQLAAERGISLDEISDEEFYALIPEATERAKIERPVKGKPK